MIELSQVPKTALDVFRMLPEGTLCEVIDNVLYMSPAPIYSHQRLVGFFYNAIFNHLKQSKTGEIIISSFDVYLEKWNSAVQPDLIYVVNDNRDIIDEEGSIHGAPDLIIEVLSQDKKRDTVKKKALYETAGVKEYVMADPKSKKLQRLDHIDGVYQCGFESEGVFKSNLLQLEFTF